MRASTPPLLLHVFPTFGVGGAQMRLVALANRFGASARHAIVAMDGATGCRDRLDPALDVAWPQVEVRKGDTRGNLRRFRRLLRALRPDVLVTSNWGSIEWAMANALPPRVRHVHMEDGFGPEERDRQLPRRVLTRRLVLRRSAVVLPSRTLLRIAAETWRLPRARLHYIPNGVDLGRFAAPRAGASPWPAAWPAAAPVIGTVAALRPEKNLARLLRAFHRALDACGPDAETTPRLAILGDGGERAALEALARALGLEAHVHFAGYVAEPARHYAWLDIFALSSDTEQMPLSVLEAMAAGLPVAATDVGDVRAMVAAENAPFVVPTDEAALGDALAALLRAPARRAAIGAANRAKAAREYDQETMFRAWADLLLRDAAPVRPGSH